MKSAAFLVALALTAPALAQTPAPASKIEVRYSQFTLPNGLRVILHEDHSVPVVSVNVWYHVGSGRERPGRTGFAHLFEHPMFMGSGHVKPGELDLGIAAEDRRWPNLQPGQDQPLEQLTWAELADRDGHEA